MNKVFEKFIINELKVVRDGFTAQMILERIISKHGNSAYIGSTRTIGFVLKQHCIKNANGTWRNKDV